MWANEQYNPATPILSSKRSEPKNLNPKKIERHRNVVLTKNNSMFFNTKVMIGTVFVDVNQKSTTIVFIATENFS